MQHTIIRRRTALLTALAFTAVLGTSVAASAGMSTPRVPASGAHSIAYGPSSAKNTKKHVKRVATGRASVKIDNFKFGPRTLTVTAGTKVTWTNDDVVAHSVNFSSGNINSKTLGQHAKFSHMFSTPGTYKYICEIHPFMHGTIVVTA